MVLCASVWRGLVCQRWADCSELYSRHPGSIPSTSSPNMFVLLPWDYFGTLAVCVRGVGDLNSILGGQKTNLKPVFSVASSDCVAASDQFWFLSATAQGDAAFPWRMQRKRVWLGFIFMTYHFFAGKHSAQSQPFASARASIAALARTQACTRWENSMIKHIRPV